MYFLIALIISILYTLYHYVNLENSYIRPEEFSFPFILIYILLNIWFLYKYRRNNLFCFEFFFALAFFVATFYYVSFSALFETTIFDRYHNVSDYFVNKGICLSMLGYLLFLLGEIIVVLKYKTSSSTKPKAKIIKQSIPPNLPLLACALHYLTFFIILLSVFSGSYKIIFKYSLGRDGTISSIFYCSLFIIISSVFEFLKLKNKENVFFSINKLYLLNIGLVLFSLLFTGNRNEALFLLLPIALLYSLTIKHIGNKLFIFLVIIGVAIMAMIGMVRTEDGATDFLGAFYNLDMYYLTRDFATANLDLFYLVKYTDQYGDSMFSNALYQILAGIPFMQSIFLNLFDISFADRSAILTLNMLNASHNTGLGTNIIGDLYYTAGVFAVVICMFSLGYILSYLYTYFFVLKRTNIYLLLIYVFLFGNCIYCVRTEFFLMIRYIGFSIIIYLILKTFTLPYKQFISR